MGADGGQHDVDGLLEVAKPATYRRWLAQMRGGRPFNAVGRPRLTQELRDVVVRIGSENLLWGYKRIAGELTKLGLCPPSAPMGQFGMFAYRRVFGSS